MLKVFWEKKGFGSILYFVTAVLFLLIALFASCSSGAGVPEKTQNGKILVAIPDSGIDDMQYNIAVARLGHAGYNLTRYESR